MKFGILALGIITIIACAIFLYTKRTFLGTPDGPIFSSYVGLAIGLLLLIEGSVKEKKRKVRG